MSFFRRTLELLVGLVTLLALSACSPGGGPGPAGRSSELPIHELKTVTDRAQVEQLALQVVDGARPPVGYVGLLAMESQGLVGVVLAPEGWSHAGAKPQSTDIAIYLLSVPTEFKRFKEPLLVKLRTATSEFSGHAPTKITLLQPFILKPGGYDYPGQKVDSMTANGAKAAEYWLELPMSGRVAHVGGVGLPGFAGYFPIDNFAGFLAQLPRPESVKQAAPGATP